MIWYDMIWPVSPHTAVKSRPHNSLIMTEEQQTGGLAPDGEVKTTSFFGQTNFTAFLPLFQGSVGSIATGYGLDSPGSNPGQARFFAPA